MIISYTERYTKCIVLTEAFQCFLILYMVWIFNE